MDSGVTLPPLSIHFIAMSDEVNPQAQPEATEPEETPEEETAAEPEEEAVA